MTKLPFPNVLCWKWKKKNWFKGTCHISLFCFYGVMNSKMPLYILHNIGKAGLRVQLTFHLFDGVMDSTEEAQRLMIVYQEAKYQNALSVGAAIELLGNSSMYCTHKTPGNYCYSCARSLYLISRLSHGDNHFVFSHCARCLLPHVKGCVCATIVVMWLMVFTYMTVMIVLQRKVE